MATRARDPRGDIADPHDAPVRERLNPAGNGLVRERVANIQRARLLAAMDEVACEYGAASVTVAHVVARAGVSRRTFYEGFADSKDCFLATLDDALALASARVLTAYAPANGWRERIRAGLIALLQFLDDEPVKGRVLVVQALGGGPEAIARRSHALAHITAAVDAGRLEGKDREVTPLTAEGIVGGVLAVIHARLLEGDGDPLVNLVNPLMAMVVMPYLGRPAVRQELARAAVTKSRQEPTCRSANPLGALPMRLTYRTIRVLTFIASHPGSSNREVGHATDIADQGQVSKLLARLQRLGLAHNTEPRPGKGTPNAWVLTTAGCELERAMSVDAR